MAERLFLSPPHMSGRERKYIDEVFAANYIAPTGEFIDRFEKAVCAWTGAPAAVALSSGTAGIHLALRLSGVGAGDRVLASTLTFVGSVAPILYQGAEPVFVDCDTSWQADPDRVEEAIEKIRPRAFVLTHLYGQSARVDQIAQMCRHYGVILIEDAAESLGAVCGDRHTGCFGEFGVYSFNGNKILTSGGGGMLVGQDPEQVARAGKLASQAREPVVWYEHTEVGYNYRMSNVLAAIGVAQMEVLKERIRQRRRVFSWYQELLEGIEGVVWMPELPGTRGNRWLTTLLLPEGINPLEIVGLLDRADIEARPLWKPMHRQPLFAGAVCVGGERSEALFARGICLPSGSAMKRTDVERVVEVLRRGLGC